MGEFQVISQIKSLDKSIFRNLMLYKDIEDESFENIKRIGIPTPTQFQIIACLLKEKGSLYQKDLEEKLNLKRATVSGVLKTMEKNGLIKREVCNDDTRQKKIYLNQKAMNIFEENQKRIRKIEKQIVKDISKEDLNTFLNVINVMKTNLKNM